MTRTNTHSLAIALVVATMVGCGTSPAARFYTLSPTAKTEDGSTATYAVGVGPVSIPSAVDRPQFVLQVAPNRVEIDEFSVWATPLGEAIAHTVADNLAVLLGTPDVAVAPVASLTPAYRVTIDVQRFDSVRGQTVVIDAAWAVLGVASKVTRSGRTLVRETVHADSFDALAAAHSRALARVSSDIAAAIRTLAERRG